MPDAGTSNTVTYDPAVARHPLFQALLDARA